MRKLILPALLSLAFLGLASEFNDASAQRYGRSNHGYYRDYHHNHHRGHDRYYRGYYGRDDCAPRYYRSRRYYRHYEPPRRYYRRSYSSCEPRYGISIRF